MAEIQTPKKAKSLAPAPEILPPEAAGGIIKTNASPYGLTFCHKDYSKEKTHGQSRGKVWNPPEYTQKILPFNV